MAQTRLPAFQVDGRVELRLDPDLAHRLGAVILAERPKDGQALALAHQLQGSRRVEDEPPPPFEVDKRMLVKVEYQLVQRFAEIILGTDTQDKQVRAVAHQCRNLSEEADDTESDEGPVRPEKVLAGMKK